MMVLANMLSKIELFNGITIKLRIPDDENINFALYLYFHL